jgi:hypothetical protein
MLATLRVMAEENIHYETDENGVVRKYDLLTGKELAKSPTLESCLLEGQIASEIHDGQKNLRYVYSPVWKDIIVEHFATSKSPTFTALFEKPGMPSATVLAKWRSQHPDLDLAISEAKKLRAERAADIIVEEVFSDKPVDKDSLPGVKLKLDNAKYLAKTGDPDAYGDKTQVKGEFQASVTYVIDTGIKRIEEEPIEAEYQEIDNGSRTSDGERETGHSGDGGAEEAGERGQRDCDSQEGAAISGEQGEGVGEA